MYIPSNNYKIASKKVCRVPKSKIIIDGVEYTGIKYVKDHPKIIHNSTKIIGEFTTKECSISIFNRDSNLDLVGKDIEVYRGLIISDEIIEYVPQGVFEVKADSIKTNSTARTLELSVKDKSTVFDCLYGGEGNISYPCTLGEFVNEIITRHNIILETPNFPFSDFILEQQPNFDINSSTERELIAQAGELGGCKVQMSRTGGVRISKPYATGITIGRIDYKKLSSKEKQFGPINSVVLSRKNQTNNDIAYKDEESIAANGLYEWKIYDNPYVDLIREEVIETVASNIIGMSVVPFELNDAIDSYCYDINDSINITDKEGNVFSSTILSIKSTSRIFTDLSAPVQIENKTNYKLAGSSKNKIEKIALDVDYNKKRIDAVVQTQEDLSDSLVPLATSNGIELKLEKSAGQPLVEFELEGNSEQASYEGKNLFNLGLVSSTYEPTDKGFTLRNRFANTIISVDDLAKVVKPSTTYTIKIVSKIISKPAYLDPVETRDYDLLLYRPKSDTLSQVWVILNPYDKDSKKVGDVTTVYKTFTSPTDLTNVRIYGYSFYGNEDSSTTYAPAGEVEIQEIMLVEGTYNESDFPEFEPYVGGTKSPNPDYPQEITVIEGDLSLKGVGENLFDKTSTPIIQSNLTIEPLETGLRLTTKETSTGSFLYALYVLTDLTNCVGKTVRMKSNWNVSGENTARYLIGLSTADGKTRTSKSTVLVSGETASFVVPELTNEQKYLMVWLYANGGGNTGAGDYVDYNDLIVTIDDENLEYKPYQETITEIDLQGNFIAKLPNGIEDKLYLNQGHLYLEQNVGKIVLNGTENWNKDVNLDDSTDYFHIRDIGIDKNNIDSVICDHFIKGSASKQGFWGTTVFVITINKTLTGIVASDTIDQRKTKFKTWLSENNVTVYYELATPVIHDLGEYSIETLKGNSTIRAISNLQPSNMYCKYIRDIEGLDVFQTKNDMADYYNIEETESRISAAKGVIELSVETYKKLIDDQGKTITSLDKKVTQKINDDGVEFKTIKDTLQDGVETLKNSLVTININGIQVATNTSKVSSIMQNNKFAIQDNMVTDLIFVGYDKKEGRSKAEMDNLTVKNYLTAGYHRQERFEPDGEKRTGWFYVGGSI